MDQRQSPGNISIEGRNRKRHRKSRNGCGICKSRKVKCDEVKPVCTNCTKHGVECDFPRVETVTITASGSRSPSQLDSAPMSMPDQVSSQADQRAADIALDPQILQPHSKMPRLEMIHLELLHNYSTLTSQTLSSDPVIRNVWRINIPKIGFSHECVMRSILALSALHMSLSSNKKRQFYLDIARYEHGAALHEIASVLSHVTAENCSAVYVAAALTFFYAWACPRQPDEYFLISASGTAEWVFLLKGVRSVLEAWLLELRRGPCSSMFRYGQNRIEQIGQAFRTSTVWLSSVEHAQLTYLRRLVAGVATDAYTAETYEQNIENLETCFCTIFHSLYGSSRGNRNDSASPHSVTDSGPAPEALTSDIYAWLYKMTDHFIELLSQRDSPALVIFAHSCILLKYLGRCWWMQGWSTHLLQEIWDLLDEDHRLWIRWPIEETGWIPRD